MPCYCQVDVPARRATVFTSPRIDDAEYSRVALLIEGDSLSVAGRDLQVADLVPPPERP